MELYLHIPFCVKKCAYCDFLSAPATEETIEHYVQAMITEIHSYHGMYVSRKVTSVFFGGGTPSILRGRQMEQLMETLYEEFAFSEDAEISMEMNPGTVTKDKLEGYLQAGINRVSIGLQSVNDKELQMLGRIHTFQEFLDTYDMVRKCGFTNVNVDLISAIPGQTVESWEETLKTVLDLAPEHVSAYSLIVEEGTPFYQKYGESDDGACQQKDAKLPSEDEERKMYLATEQIMETYGYHRYEISNYAKAGYECRHNLGYWKREEYLGIGLGAASLMDEVRFNRINDLGEYLKFCSEYKGEELLNSLTTEKETLTTRAQMEEYMFLGLRLIKGVSISKFYTIFGKEMKDIYGEVIEENIEKGLLQKCEDNLSLTKRGLDLSNYVMSSFLIED